MDSRQWTTVEMGQGFAISSLADLEAVMYAPRPRFQTG
jgi:hypothetical protein